MKVQTNKLTMEEKQYGRKYSGSMGIHAPVGFTELLARYLDNIELAYIT